MRLSILEGVDGVEAAPGNRVIYDLERDEAHFGPASVDGHALVWELGVEDAANAKLSAVVELDSSVEWMMRCDRVDFPPGGVAYTHTHPGPGIRCLLHGEIRIETGGRSTVYGPLEPWFESGPEPVLAEASASADTAFVRVMLLPREWEGRRTITYVNPEDADKPKTQKASIFFDQSIEL